MPGRSRTTSTRWPTTTRGPTTGCSPPAASCRRTISSRRARASFPRSRRRSTTISPSTGTTSMRWSASFAGQPANPEPGASSNRRSRSPSAASCTPRSAPSTTGWSTRAEALTDAQLELPVAIPRRKGVEHETVTRLLAHLFQHQIHHRGQAHAMLAGTHVKPPQLDEFFCANEAHLRAAELAELGLSEAAIWRTRPGPDGEGARQALPRRVESPGRHALGLPHLPFAAARRLRARAGAGRRRAPVRRRQRRPLSARRRGQRGRARRPASARAS